MNPTQFLQTLPLRSKLIAALTLPIFGLLVLGGINVRGLQGVLGEADQQLDVVDTNVALVNVSSALRTERDIQLTIPAAAGGDGGDVGGANQFLAIVREETDLQIAQALELTSLDASDRVNLESVRDRLTVTRTLLGNDLGATQAGLMSDVRSGSRRPGSVSDSLASLDALVGDVIDLIDIDAELELDARTALDVTTLQIASEFDEAVRREALGYLRLTLFNPEDRPDALVTNARRLGGNSLQLEGLIGQVGSPDAAAAFDDFFDSSRYRGFADLRQSVSTTDAASIEVSETVVLNTMLSLTNSLGIVRDDLLAQVRSQALDSRSAAQQQLVLGGIALAALTALVAGLSVTLFRSIRGPLTTLTDRSREISDVELPQVVRLLRTEGIAAEVPEIVPIESQTDDEIGDLVAAFNDMHRTAVELASEQAASRKTVADMFVNLGRRNQRLLMRILDYLDGLEQNEKNPETLENLFKIDHLVTRMRRNAESLLVLAGAGESRIFDEAVSVGDVVRSAMSEVEGYERVELDLRSEVFVDGSAVADLGHLLAELIENGLSFSRPGSPVMVSALQTPRGYTLAIVDSGLGMTPERIQMANQTIEGASTLEETDSSDLGHHVVGRLASRHGISVRILEGITEGLVVKVLLPDSLIAKTPAGPKAIDNAPAAPTPQPAIEAPVVEEAPVTRPAPPQPQPPQFVPPQPQAPQFVPEPAAPQPAAAQLASQSALARRVDEARSQPATPVTRREQVTPSTRAPGAPIPTAPVRQPETQATLRSAADLVRRREDRPTTPSPSGLARRSPTVRTEPVAEPAADQPAPTNPLDGENFSANLASFQTATRAADDTDKGALR